MKFLRLLIPSFLRQIDHYLLLHYPILWETRVHFVAFYSLVCFNALAVAVGLLYPVSRANVPDFNNLVAVLNLSFFLAFMVLSYYAYQQSIKRRLIYSLKEILLRTLIYGFCTLSVLGNALVFPNVVRWRVQLIFDKEELERDYQALLKEQYIVSLTDYIKNNAVFEENRESYLNLLKKSSLNKRGIINSYLSIHKELRDIRSDLYLHDYEKYQKRKESLSNWESAHGIYYDTDESPFDLYFPSKAVEKAYWRKKHELLGYLQPDSIRIAQFILAKNWQKEFKYALLDDLDLSIILERRFASLENNEKVISESPVIQHLHKKYQTPVYQSQTDYYELTYKVSNLYIFYDSNPFFKINPIYNRYLYTLGSRLLGEEFLDELTELDDVVDLHKEKIDQAVAILLNEKNVDKKTFEFVHPGKVFDYQFLARILLIFAYMLIVLWSGPYSLRNFFISAFLLFFGFVGIMFAFGITTSFMRLDMPEPVFFLLFFPSLIGLFALILSVWVSVQNHNKGVFRFLPIFLHLASIVCYVVTALFAFFAEPYQLGELTAYGQLYRYLDMAFYFYFILFLLNIYLYWLYNRVMARPLSR